MINKKKITVTNLTRSTFQLHPFHLVSPSSWPMFASFISIFPIGIFLYTQLVAYIFSFLFVFGQKPLGYDSDSVKFNSPQEWLQTFYDAFLNPLDLSINLYTFICANYLFGLLFILGCLTIFTMFFNFIKKIADVATNKNGFYITKVIFSKQIFIFALQVSRELKQWFSINRKNLLYFFVFTVAFVFFLRYLYTYVTYGFVNDTNTNLSFIIMLLITSLFINLCTLLLRHRIFFNKENNKPISLNNSYKSITYSNFIFISASYCVYAHLVVPQLCFVMPKIRDGFVCSLTELLGTRKVPHGLEPLFIIFKGSRPLTRTCFIQSLNYERFSLYHGVATTPRFRDIALTGINYKDIAFKSSANTLLSKISIFIVESNIFRTSEHTQLLVQPSRVMSALNDKNIFVVTDVKNTVGTVKPKFFCFVGLGRQINIELPDIVKTLGNNNISVVNINSNSYYCVTDKACVINTYSDAISALNKGLINGIGKKVTSLNITGARAYIDYPLCIDLPGGSSTIYSTGINSIDCIAVNNKVSENIFVNPKNITPPFVHSDLAALYPASKSLAPNPSKWDELPGKNIGRDNYLIANLAREYNRGLIVNMVRIPDLPILNSTNDNLEILQQSKQESQIFYDSVQYQSRVTGDLTYNRKLIDNLPSHQETLVSKSGVTEYYSDIYTQRFSLVAGLRKTNWPWLIFDNRFEEMHKLRYGLLTDPSTRYKVYQIHPNYDVRHESRQTFLLVLNFLLKKHPNLFTLTGTNHDGFVTNKLTNQTFDIKSFEPLDLCSRLTNDDFNIVRKVDGYYRLIASTTLLPAAWKLEDKIGYKISDLHGPVPLWEEKLAKRVYNAFDDIINKTRDTHSRDNMFVQMSSNLFTREPHEIYWPVDANLIGKPGGFAFEDMYLRREYQSFCRIPAPSSDLDSNSLVFTVHTAIDRMVDLSDSDLIKFHQAVTKWPDKAIIDGTAEPGIASYKGRDCWGPVVNKYMETRGLIPV